MLLCNTCLSSFTNPESGFKSRGPCEVCGTVGLCNEIPSKYLEAKSKKPHRLAIVGEWNYRVLQDRIKDLYQLGYLPLEQR